MWGFVFFAPYLFSLFKCGYIYQIQALELLCISQWDWISVNLIITIFECKGKISESAQDAALLDMYEWVGAGGQCARLACMKMRVVPLLTCLQRCLRPTLQISLGSARQSAASRRTEPRFALLAASATASSSLFTLRPSFFFFFNQIHEYREGNTFASGMKHLVLLETKMPWG